ncbi:MAG: hypothetical protein WKF60_09955 [Ilumatobacter sp.]
MIPERGHRDGRQATALRGDGVKLTCDGLLFDSHLVEVWDESTAVSVEGYVDDWISHTGPSTIRVVFALMQSVPGVCACHSELSVGSGQFNAGMDDFDTFDRAVERSESDRSPAFQECPVPQLGGGLKRDHLALPASIGS